VAKAIQVVSRPDRNVTGTLARTQTSSPGPAVVHPSWESTVNSPDRTTMTSS